MQGRSVVVLLLFLACSGVMESVAAAPAGGRAGAGGVQPPPPFELQPNMPYASRMIADARLSSRVAEDAEYARQLAQLQSNLLEDVDVPRVLEAVAKTVATVDLSSLTSVIDGLHGLVDALVPTHSEWIKEAATKHDNPWVRGLAMFPQSAPMRKAGHFFQRLGEYKQTSLVSPAPLQVNIDPAALEEMDRLLAEHMDRVVEAHDFKSFLIHHAQLMREARERPKVQMIVAQMPPSPSQWVSLFGSLPSLRQRAFTPSYLDRVGHMNQRFYPDGGWADISFLQTGQDTPDAPPPSPPAEGTAADDNATQPAAAPAEEELTEEDNEVELATDAKISCFEGDPSTSCTIDNTLKPLVFFGVFGMVVGGFLGIIDDRARDLKGVKLNPSNPEGKDCVTVGPEVAKYVFKLLTTQQAEMLVCKKEFIGDIGVILINIAMWCFAGYVFVAFFVSSREAAAYYQDALPNVGSLIDEKEMVDLSEKDISLLELDSELKLEHVLQLKTTGGWKQVNQEGGEPYYWNEETNEVVWELPEGAEIAPDPSAPVDASALPGDLDSYSEEKQEMAKQMMKAALSKNKGKISLADFLEVMTYLEYPVDEKLSVLSLLSTAKVGSRGLFKKAMLGRDYNPDLKLSVANINSVASAPEPTISREMQGNCISLLLGLLFWVWCFVCMCSTNDSTTVLVALCGIPLLHMTVYYQNWIVKKSKEEIKKTKGDADSGPPEANSSALKSAYKIMIILLCIHIFATLYYFSKRCLEPTVHCPVEGTKPVCKSTGLPPSRYQCSMWSDESGASVCDYSDRIRDLDTLQADETCQGDVSSIVCLHEEVPEGMFDNGMYTELWQKNARGSEAHNSVIGSSSHQHQFYQSLSALYHIGLTDIAPQCIKDSVYSGSRDTYMKFKSNAKHYVYAEASMETQIQNVFTSMNASLLPAMDQLHGIYSIALINGEYPCTDNDNRGSAKTLNTSLTTAELLATPKLTVFTPDGGVGNFRMCYWKGGATTGSWETVPDLWVLVGEGGSCGSKDCTGADFSDGMGSHFSDALYYSLITQSTIGYGDILAMSTKARMLTAMQALVMMFIDLI